MHGARPEVPVMKMGIKKHLAILPLVLPLMLALTSCSTVSSHQSMPTSSGVVSTHSTQSISHHKTKVKQHTSMRHSRIITSKHTQAYQLHSPKQVATSQPKSTNEQPRLVEVISPFDVIPAKAAPVQSARTSSTNGQYWLLSVQGVDLNPGAYKNIGGRPAIIANIGRLDYLDGHRHYIQAARWDGDHISQSYINATQAELVAIMGLSLLENGYIETGYGTTFMMLAGNGHIFDIPGHRFELILIRAASGPAAAHSSVIHSPFAPEKKGDKNSRKKRKSVSLLENYNFTVGENQVVSVLESHLSQIAATDEHVKPSTLSSPQMPVRAEANIMHCTRTAAANPKSMANAQCVLNEAMNNVSIMQLTQGLKDYCVTNYHATQATCIADFGSHSQSAIND